jgi:hypothetical protein
MTLRLPLGCNLVNLLVTRLIILLWRVVVPVGQTAELAAGLAVY